MCQEQDLIPIIQPGDDRYPYYKEVARRVVQGLERLPGDRREICLGAPTTNLTPQMTVLYYSIEEMSGSRRKAAWFRKHEGDHRRREKPGEEGYFSLISEGDWYAAGYYPAGKRTSHEFISIIEGPDKQSKRDDVLRQTCQRLIVEGRGDEGLTIKKLKRIAQDEYGFEIG